MDLFGEYQKEIQRFPDALQKLIEEELKAGNQILELGHSFPAAPCGAYIVLAAAVSTRERVSTAELHFYDRDTMNYSGEFTDKNRHYFVLEPPHPPTPPPDMEAIRARIDAEYASNPKLFGVDERLSTDNENILDGESLTIARFVKSMEMTYDKWKEGEGYDLSLLESASVAERNSIEKIVLRNSPHGWRDIEVLAAIDSPRCRDAILDAFENGDTQTRFAVHRYSPELLTEKQRIDSIVSSLSESEIYTGLSETLDEIEDFHPPDVIQALLNGLSKRDGAAACHFAAMLYFLHGKAESAFDWAHRPFFLRFNTDKLDERDVAIRELCQAIGVEAASYLSDSR